MGKGPELTGCPSGCPRVSREAFVFDMPTPHITVLWDGDKIDKIAVPEVHRTNSRTLLRLSVAEVTRLVEELLSSKGYVQPGLSMRIHSRDAISEYAFRRLHAF